MNKVIRVSTVPQSLRGLLKGQLKFLSENGFEVIGVSSSGQALEEVQQNEGVRTVTVEMERLIYPFKDLRSLVELYSHFKKEKPLIVHSITPKAGLLSMIASKLAGVPIRLHTFTGLIFPSKRGILQKILILMDRLLCYCATNIYPEGEGVKKDLIAYNITNKPLKILANGNVNGIDINYFNPSLFSREERDQLRQELGINNEDFIFIFVGRLVKDKGINELVEAFNIISSENKNARLLLVGPQEPELDPLKDETLFSIENNKNIVSVGYQSDVRPYFAISNALVFPSYREGFPNVVMQAGAMELPSIVSNINGCNEIIVEGENGTIIPTKNSNALKEKMLLFLEDEDYIASLRSKSREMITSRYERQVVWEAILDEYKRLEKAYVPKLS